MPSCSVSIVPAVSASATGIELSATSFDVELSVTVDKFRDVVEIGKSAAGTACDGGDVCCSTITEESRVEAIALLAIVHAPSYDKILLFLSSEFETV